MNCYSTRPAEQRTAAVAARNLRVGADTIKLATQRQVATHRASLKERGAPAWIDRVQGNELTVVFFADHRKDFQSLLGGDPWGKGVHALLADEELNPLSSGVAAMRIQKPSARRRDHRHVRVQRHSLGDRTGATIGRLSAGTRPTHFSERLADAARPATEPVIEKIGVLPASLHELPGRIC